MQNTTKLLAPSWEVDPGIGVWFTEVLSKGELLKFEKQKLIRDIMT